MKTFTGILFFAVILGAAIWYTEFRKPPITFRNSKVGFEMTHSNEWKIVKKMDLGGLLAGADMLFNIGGGDGDDGMKEIRKLAPMFVAMAKGGGAENSKEASFHLMAIRLPEKGLQSAFGDMDGLIDLSTNLMQTSSPGAEVKEGLLPLPNHPEVKNFFSSIMLDGAKVNSYQYTYTRDSFIVQFGFTWTRPEDEGEIKNMIETIRLEGIDEKAK